ncbi:MAG: COX15/CtaA family protein, partial [Gammaproteobacteria bacterium]|nr:COX15/CtaA family protein [Gammaproteobacteria bacterium]
MTDTHTYSQSLSRYRRFAWITIAAVYFLILVGASVRASGAGMGCPDWPTCFGQWIPPTSEAQLPADYQEIYAELGYADTRFNVVKTWTEYTNRLVGVTIGFLVFLTAVFSWSCRRHDPWIFRASVAAFFMVGFEGWLGSQVVSSNLQPGLITLHMLMALAIVAALLFALAQSRRGIMAAQPI